MLNDAQWALEEAGLDVQTLTAEQARGHGFEIDAPAIDILRKYYNKRYGLRRQVQVAGRPLNNHSHGLSDTGARLMLQAREARRQVHNIN